MRDLTLKKAVVLALGVLLCLIPMSGLKAETANYPNGARLQDSLGYLYYPNGARLRDSLGYVYYPNGAKVRDTLKYVYYPNGAKLRDSLGYLYYPNGKCLKNSLGYVYHSNGTCARNSLGQTYYENGASAGGAITLRVPLGENYGYLKVRAAKNEFKALVVLELGYDRTFTIDVESGKWWLE